MFRSIGCRFEERIHWIWIQVLLNGESIPVDLSFADPFPTSDAWWDSSVQHQMLCSLVWGYSILCMVQRLMLLRIWSSYWRERGQRYSGTRTCALLMFGKGWSSVFISWLGDIRSRWAGTTEQGHGLEGYALHKKKLKTHKQANWNLHRVPRP